MANVLRLFTVKHRLSLPVLDLHAWWNPDCMTFLLNRDALKQRRFDMMFEQVVYNRTTTQRLVDDNAVRVTMLRHPFEHFKSLFNFEQRAKRYGIVGNDALTTFLSDPARWEPLSGANASRTQNFQFQSFGHFPSGIVHNESVIDDVIRMIETDFDLVLIHEHYDESLVLLTRRLGWSLYDVAYLRARRKIYADKFRRHDVTALAQHRRWNPWDYRLYEHFLARFKPLLDDHTLHRDVSVLRRINRSVQRQCRRVFTRLRLYRHGALAESKLIQELDAEVIHNSSIKAKDCIILAIDPNVFDCKSRTDLWSCPRAARAASPGCRR